MSFNNHPYMTLQKSLNIQVTLQRQETQLYFVSIPKWYSLMHMRNVKNLKPIELANAYMILSFIYIKNPYLNLIRLIEIIYIV